MSKRQHQTGYSLLEAIIALLVLTIITTAVAYNLPAISSTVDIELATTQVVSSVAAARRAAMAGHPNNRLVKLSTVVPANHPGTAITNSAANGSKSCQQQCQNGNVICLSGKPFCYNPVSQFEFEQYTGELSEPRAIFLLSDRRKFCVLVQVSGQLLIGEFINGEWINRADLQQPEQQSTKH